MQTILQAGEALTGDPCGELDVSAVLSSIETLQVSAQVMEWTQTILQAGEAFTGGPCGVLRASLHKASGRFFPAHHSANVSLAVSLLDAELWTPLPVPAAQCVPGCLLCFRRDVALRCLDSRNQRIIPMSPVQASRYMFPPILGEQTGPFCVQSPVHGGRFCSGGPRRRRSGQCRFCSLGGRRQPLALWTG